MIDGAVTKPFSATTVPSIDGVSHRDRKEAVLNQD
jgi:hypothetical protein